MKKIAILALSSLILSGCTVDSGGGSTTRPGPNFASVLGNPVVLSTTASLTTSVTLKNIKESDRQKVARFVFAIASGIRATAESGTFSQSSLDVLSQKLLSGVQVEYRSEVGILVSTLQALALDRLNQALAEVQAGNQEKANAYRELVVAVAGGVERTALTFAGGTPSLVIGAAGEDYGDIHVPALRWR